MKSTLLLLAALTTIVAGPAPAFAAHSSDLGAVLSGNTWLNGRVTGGDVRGRVVIVDVFTFECINCIRVTPNLQRLYRAYGRSDLEIIGVHTPEVPSYQQRLRYLRDRVGKTSIPWPIVVDNDYGIWQAYGVSSWPTQLVFDSTGRLRATIAGDSQDATVDRTIADLVRMRRLKIVGSRTEACLKTRKRELGSIRRT